MPRARSRADGVARQARLSRGLDRRTPFGGVRDHQLAGDLHRLRRRAHPKHPLRHRRRFAALPPPDDGRRPHRPTRPHDPRPGHVRRGTRPLGVRRDHDGHRPADPARPHGPVDRRDPAPVQGRDRHREDRLVHDGRLPAPPPALHEALSRGRGGQRDHAVGRAARRQIRSRHDLRRRDQPVRL